MKKVLVGLVVLVATMLGSLSLAAPAQAYPEVPPSTPPQVQSGGPAAPADSTASALPNTGGPDVLILGGAAALLLAGGVVLVSVRRRDAD